MEKIFIFTTFLSIAVTVNSYKTKFFSQSLDSEPPISILYARDQKSDKITNDCLTEMYPRNLYKYPLRIDRNDIPCIIHCVLKKFDILLLTLLTLVGLAHARISVMYAHDKLSDIVAGQCLSEMYPKNKRIEVQESDEPCIIFCVLKKFGIMSTTGVINLEIYKKRVRFAHQLDQRTGLTDYGGNCMESAEATQHKQDVCKKAKVFNDCTHLYRILLK
ncbi:hypothetical protein PYW08_006237 [Mythimna loreyi]|uniref:Uncharacterized protein n=1 Tax=Mythimna loreyi TaxID=667449 RepID=A0ACC2QPM0_9NEOP|nr:hypothetical protein PYW08_006237 [Mythimna loreyi]